MVEQDANFGNYSTPTEYAVKIIPRPLSYAVKIIPRPLSMR